MKAIYQMPHQTSTSERALHRASDAHTSHRGIAARTSGRIHGPVNRLVSPGMAGSYLKPFVFLDYFDFQSTGETMFPMHPHSGIATTTVLLEGGMRYEDTTGASGVLKAGSVEWMRAGKGVWHDGVPLPGQRLRGYQLWLALPEALELAPAQSQYLEPAEVPVVGKVRVILGQYQGAHSKVNSPEGIQYLHVSLNAGESIELQPPPSHQVAWLHVGSGSLLSGMERIADELVVFEEGDQAVRLTAEHASDFIFGTARKHPHDLVLGSYSVHTSHAALRLGEQEIARLGEQLRASGRAI
ncbi:pirin family protein [Ideonella azotifigens]|uniref:Pirin family protein n=1 Tax=Ideonella azotifigens TaxID=513160 RepID=A0ABP3VRZ4_9BURK|nr:pirin family protein [Ideonella azotifigens]MCD2339537.1 pirin family protein [Ideonella azotifigens]